MAEESGIKPIAANRRAYHDYHILDKFEAGIALTGTEVKSLRVNGCSLVDGYANIRNGEVWLLNFDPTIGAEIKKTRPALIIQNDTQKPSFRMTLPDQRAR